MLRVLGVILIAVLGVVSAAAAELNDSCWVNNSAASEHGLWLLCQEGSLYVSSDQGANWQTKPLPSGMRFRTLGFATDRKGFVAGDDGVLIATEDGGSNWRKVESSTDRNLLSIQFVGDKGWIAGYDGVILHSGDGGKTWGKQKSDTTQPLESIYFTDAEHGWAVGWVGTLVRTTDGGQTWKLIDLPEDFWTFSSVYFRDNDNGWIVGFQGRILRTRDGGLTWKALPSPVSNWLTSVRFDRQGRGWIAADSDLLVSEDGGESWRAIPVDDSIFVGRIQPAGDTLWAVGLLGLLQQSNTREVSVKEVQVPGIGFWQEEQENAVAAEDVPPTPAGTSRGRP
jgi:photosystem II stability/assembly factor-like uncharacterized protein